MSCKLCGKSRPLVDAHIIPESFFRDARVGEEALHLIANDPAKFPKRAPKGVYDRELVCDPCERIFGPWDGYAAELLINRRDIAFGPLVTAEGRIGPAQSADPYDYVLLRLFVLSLLWRAAASSHPFFARIQLPRRIDRLADLVRAKDVGRQSEFRTVVTRWRRDPDWPEAGLIADPFELRASTGQRMARFYLGAFALDIQIDDAAPEALWEVMRMGPNRPLYAVERSLRGSNDMRALDPAIRNWLRR